MYERVIVVHRYHEEGIEEEVGHLNILTTTAASMNGGKER